MRMAIVIVTASLAPLASGGVGPISPFTETFEGGAANWRNANGTTELDWFASGGPDGSAYASGVLNLSGASGFFPPTFMRAQENFDSSGGAFVGNWIAAGVVGFAFDIRHDLPEPITITTRFATPDNNPGASTESPFMVMPNTWTRITLDLTPDSPDIISFGSGDYQMVFEDIGRIQFGLNVPASLAGQNIDGRFDIDNAGVIVPAPGSLALALGLGLLARRRR